MTVNQSRLITQWMKRFNVNKRLMSLFMFITIALPNFGNGLRLRGWLYSRLVHQCGKRFKVGPLGNLYNPESLVIGDDVYIGHCSYIGDGDVEIEDQVVIGPFCAITAGNHLFKDDSVRFGGYEYKAIKIGRGTWLGAHVNVLAGVTIGKGCLVAAGAVVTQDVPDNVVVAGVPAKVVKANNGHSGVNADHQRGMV